MKRLLRWLAGLLVPRPPPKDDLTPKDQFVKQEKELARLDAHLSYYKLTKKKS